MPSSPDSPQDDTPRSEDTCHFSRREMLGVLGATLLYPVVGGAAGLSGCAASPSVAERLPVAGTDTGKLWMSSRDKAGDFDDAMADTVQDFSGRQGYGHWFYGHARSAQHYSDQQFQAFTTFSHGMWESAKAGTAEIGVRAMAPALGTAVVRRWKAKRTGSVRLVGVFQKAEGGPGVCRVFVNGVPRWTREVSAADTIPHAFDILLYDVPRGASVDLVAGAAHGSARAPARFSWALQIVSETCTAWRADLPIGPQFTDAAKQAQRRAGKSLLANIQRASAAGRHTFTIGPGDYRFSGAMNEYPHLRNLKNLMLEAHGVTFWFDAPLVHGLEFDDCQNVHVKGLTLDCDPLPFFQGRITAIQDAEHRAGHSNRRIVTAKIMPGYEASFFSQTQGHRAVSYYRPDGSYVRNGIIGAQWRRLHGGRFVQVQAPAPGVRVGDYLTCVIRTGQQLRSINCAGMVYEDCNIYAGGGMAVMEAGGEGGSVYKRFRATRRPGTNRLHAFGADGFHFNAVGKGPVMDRCEGAYFADDEVNLHGHFGEIVQRLAANYYLLKGTAGAYVAGGRLDFWDFFTLQYDGHAVISEVHFSANKQAWDVTLDRKLDLPSKVLINCHRQDSRDYVIKNCWFHDTGQRFLVNGAPGGRTENTTFQNLGGGVPIEMESWSSYTEGAFPDHTTFKNNRLIDMPYAVVIRPYPRDRHGHHIRRSMPFKDIAVEANYFQNAGEPILAQQVDGLTVKANVFDQPFESRQGGFALIRSGFGNAVDAPIYLAAVKNAVIEGNQMYDPLDRTHGRIVRLGVLTSDITIDGQRQWNTIADSISSWWPQPPVQGRCGWRYGTLPVTAAEGSRYRLDAFKQLPRHGDLWRATPHGYPLIDVSMMHPSHDLAAVRRWTSHVAGEARVEGVIRHTSNHGNGTRMGVFLDGRRIWSQELSSDRPHQFQIKLRRLRIGSTLDFVVTPKKNDTHAATRCFFKILTPPKNQASHP